jgi:hypothetical protein
MQFSGQVFKYETDYVHTMNVSQNKDFRKSILTNSISLMIRIQTFEAFPVFFHGNLSMKTSE